jgi:hypothetical protein
MKDYIVVQHESAEIRANTPEEAKEKFMEYLEGIAEWSIYAYDAKTREEV